MQPTDPGTSRSKKHFILDIDASQEAIGRVRSQDAHGAMAPVFSGSAASLSSDIRNTR